jgi:hypothetical protein
LELVALVARRQTIPMLYQEVILFFQQLHLQAAALVQAGPIMAVPVDQAAAQPTVARLMLEAREQQVKVLQAEPVTFLI